MKSYTKVKSLTYPHLTGIVQFQWNSRSSMVKWNDGFRQIVDDNRLEVIDD